MMLIWLSFSLLVAAFYLLYSTSQRAIYKRRPLNNWLLRQAPWSKATGLVLGLLSVWLLGVELGAVAGFFVGLLAFMTIASLTILFHPLNR